MYNPFHCIFNLKCGVKLLQHQKLKWNILPHFKCYNYSLPLWQCSRQITMNHFKCFNCVTVVCCILKALIYKISIWWQFQLARGVIRPLECRDRSRDHQLKARQCRLHHLDLLLQETPHEPKVCFSLMWYFV